MSSAADVPLPLTAALALAEEVLRSRGDLRISLSRVEIVERWSTGFRYRIHVRNLHGVESPGNTGQVDGLAIGTQLSRITFNERPSGTMRYLYALPALPLLAAFIPSEQGSTTLLLVGFAVVMAAMLFLLTRYVAGKGPAMAAELARRAGAGGRSAVPGASRRR